MTTKAEAAAAERKVMARYEARLARAFAPMTKTPKPTTVMSGRFDGKTAITDGVFAATLAATQLRILTASAKALFPGAQKRKHVLPALGVMVTAACRVIRRGGK